MSSRRLFLYVFCAVLALDLAAHLVTRAGPAVGGANGLGRMVICLAAGAVAGRTSPFGRTLAGTLLGVMAATLVTLAVYIVTGLAAAEASGPRTVYALAAVSAAIAIVATLAGLMLARLGRRSDRARPA